MPLVPVPPGGLDLGRPAQIQVTDMRILVPSMLQFLPGGLDIEHCQLRCEIVDIPRGIVFKVPITKQGAINLHKQLGDIISALTTSPEVKP